MRILVIGGSQFIGKHFVQQALQRGHELTLFNRGSRPAPAGVTRSIVGDRNSDLGKLAGGHWDAVVDTSGYLPRQVQGAAEALEASAPRYLFVSTISVYADLSRPYVDEDGELARLEDETVETVDGQTYGGLKVLCEEALAAVYPPERRLVIRPSLVVGPGDHTDRFTYWPVRLARGGEVLAPATPDRPLQWIDARDLAAWMVEGLEQGLSGTYNAASEADRFDMGGLLEAAAQAAPAGTRLSWVDEAFLLEQQVQPFADLPFWLPGEQGNLLRVDASRAHANGLRSRSVEETVRDTLAWHQERGAPELKVGLSAERERELLAAWGKR